MIAISLREDRVSEAPLLAKKLALIKDGWSIDVHKSGLVGSGQNVYRFQDVDLWMDSAGITDRRRSSRLDYNLFAKRLNQVGADAICDLSPPFRMIWKSSLGYYALSDWYGLAHLYVWQSSGLAVVSTSAVLLAQLFDLQPDVDALIGPALIGSMLQNDSVIQGVRKLPCGQIAHLQNGHLFYLSQPEPSQLVSDETALVSAISAHSAAWPSAEIEVSGGFDSRLIVAAISTLLCRSHRAITLGSEGTLEVEIARQVCDIAGLSQLVFNPQVCTLNRTEIEEALLSSALRDEFSSNPVDRMALNVFSDNREAEARFSGLNGEILRGFYYPGQPVLATPSSKLAKSLIRWRVISNDLVDPKLFCGTWYTDNKQRSIERLQASLLFGEGNWGSRLDTFYLEQRMQRWCGISVSAAIDRRPLLMPFFDPDVIRFASSLSPALKSNSKYAAQLIAKLNPQLAVVPTDGGQYLTDIAKPNVLASVRSVGRLISKSTRKIYQQFALGDRQTFGSNRTMPMLFEHGVLGSIDVTRILNLGILSEQAVISICEGKQRPNRSTAGFLLNLDRLLSTLEPIKYSNVR